jgi:hypothetical protein
MAGAGAAARGRPGIRAGGSDGGRGGCCRRRVDVVPARPETPSGKILRLG